MAFSHQLFQAFERGVFFGDKRIGIGHGTAVEFGAVAKAPPDQIGFQAKERITSANSAAFNRFKQIGVGHAVGNFKESRDRCIEVRGERCRENLRNAVFVILLETGEIRFDFHGNVRLPVLWCGWIFIRKRAACLNKPPFALDDQFAAAGA